MLPVWKVLRGMECTCGDAELDVSRTLKRADGPAERGSAEANSKLLAQ